MLTNMDANILTNKVSIYIYIIYTGEAKLYCIEYYTDI